MSVDDPIEDLLDIQTATDQASVDQEDLAARVEYLKAENEQLRREYTHARRSQYRRTALGLVLVGLLAVGGGLLFADARTVLFALGGTGVFAGLLTVYLTPEKFIPADIGERVYAALAANEAALVADLGLTDDRVYVPTRTAGDTAVRLFIPQHTIESLPDAETLDTVFVTPEDDQQRGVSLRPTGDALFEEFVRATTGQPADDPETLVEQLTDALVEQFELIESARVDVDAANDRASVGIGGSIYGRVDQFDHPVVSFIAVGLARQLDIPTRVTVDDAGDDRVDALLTFQWAINEADDREKER